jgi:hypothetical protein
VPHGGACSASAGLLWCRAFELTVDSSLLDPLMPLCLGALGCQLSLTLFLLKFSLPFNTPFILMDGTLSQLIPKWGSSEAMAKPFR